MKESEYLQVAIDKFIFRVRTDCLFDEAGVWIAIEHATGIARVGLTDFRQQTSGDVVFVELPEPGIHVVAGDDLASIETIKVDLALPAPAAGEVVRVNEALIDAPELINQDPYGVGWLVELKPAIWPAPGLLGPEAYLALMTAQAEEASK
jgi:glycine cleavage system H protein